MAATLGFRHDLFISYAHADNETLAGSKVGFVSQLVDDLRKLVGSKVSKELDIWWDHRNLSGNAAVTPEIMRAAGESAGIIMVVSPAYLRSEWCSRERTAFFDLLKGREPGDPAAVFMVNIDPIEQGKLPAGLRDLTGYPFFCTLDNGRTTRPLRTDLDTDRTFYYNRLSELAQDLSKHLESLQSKAPTTPSRSLIAAEPGAAPSTEVSRPCVLLLEVTDDLVQRRAELKEYLEESRIVVLPEKRYSRDDMTLHRQQLLADLARSRTCVQILGPLSGDLSDHPRGMAWLRYETIRGSECTIPFIQWRDPDLDLAAVTDPNACELIKPPSVRTDRFPDFRRAIAELTLKPLEPVKTRTPQGVQSVFVNYDLLDRELGAQVAQWLEERGFMVLEPPQSTQDSRKEWESILAECDSLMLVYGQTKPNWVKAQLMFSNRVERPADYKELLRCICVGPPVIDPTRDKVTDLAIRYPGIYYVRTDGSTQLNQTELENFVARLRGVNG
jgi:hypothetical protein